MNQRIPIAIIILFLLNLGCVPYTEQDSGRRTPPPVEDRSGSGNRSSSNKATEASYGKAAFISDDLRGRLTASGEAYDPNKLTAAHLTLPFGTLCRITNMTNGRTVEVRVNDRFAGSGGRIILLSREAARQLDAINAGVIEIKLEVLQKPNY